MERCKPLGSLSLFLSYAPQLSAANPVSLFTLENGRWLLLAFPPAPQQSLLGVVASVGSFGESSFTFGGQESLITLTFDIAGDIFISHLE